ncbi:MAG TPA: methyltransferase domain-containing protein [Nocardioides sp.]|uniref:class I SAM-dependent methyltransferase n=1 Tax=Nocardioides sp. TaxID=35761 RepID=UPI002E33881A|nr:methyltransferase domain-containing protein [Nocardioides sp.]HEX5089004.1 methyltransferase domain-containing protein [Nocardioides sp.]
MSAAEAHLCRGCRSTRGQVVLDLGDQPAADHFPLATDPGPDPRHPLAMWWCADCGLAQLLADATVPDEPRAIEPRAAVRQAHEAVAELVGAGLLVPGGFIEFASPHGGSWRGALEECGFRPAQGDRAGVVIDVYGLMHDRDQAAGLRARAAALTDDGTLVLQFPTYAATVRRREWNALRHGHFAYHSVPAARRLLDAAGLTAFAARTYSLYSGSVLLLASRSGAGPATEAAALDELERAELAAGVLDPTAMAALGAALEDDVSRLRRWVDDQPGGAWLYGAGSRAVAVLAAAGLRPGAVAGIADGAPAKQGRRMPGTDIPVVAPEALLAADPDHILLMLPDLADELRDAWPSMADRWVVYGSH